MYSTFMRHILGAQSDSSIEDLKEALGVDKLELVMLDSLEEYMRLLAEKGVPAARLKHSTDPEPLP